MIVVLTITTWRGQIGATHYYGKLREYEWEWTEDDLRVKHPLTAEQAAVVNKKDGMVGKPYAYEAGDPSERFDDEQSLKKAAIRMACEKWGADVEIYVGNCARMLEDMEKLLWVRPKKA